MLKTSLLILLLLLTGVGFSVLFAKPANRQSTATEVNIGKDSVTKSSVPNINIEYLRNLKINSKEPDIVEELTDGSNYKRYIASYISEGNTVFGLLTVPIEEPPKEGYSAIVFNHGYIPPNQYVTTEKYIAYVDYLARNGFVVFKIDMRGHGNSEGTPTGSYFSSGYTIDAISALKSLQKLPYVNPQKIGMWGHSMAGNSVLRAMLVEPDIKAGVIWAGAVYSYEDFAKYRLHDSSYVRREPNPHYDTRDLDRGLSGEISDLREKPEEVDFTNDFWAGISLTQNINYLEAPIQLHHAVNDPTVNINYSRDLVEVLKANDKTYEFYEYPGGGHNIESPYFEQAMKRTVEFFEREFD